MKQLVYWSKSRDAQTIWQKHIKILITRSIINKEHLPVLEQKFKHYGIHKERNP